LSLTTLAAVAAFPFEGPLWSGLCFILFTLSYFNWSLCSTAATSLLSLALVVTFEGVIFEGVTFDGVTFDGVTLEGVPFLAGGDLDN